MLKFNSLWLIQVCCTLPPLLLAMPDNRQSLQGRHRLRRLKLAEFKEQAKAELPEDASAVAIEKGVMKLVRRLYNSLSPATQLKLAQGHLVQEAELQPAPEAEELGAEPPESSQAGESSQGTDVPSIPLVPLNSIEKTRGARTYLHHNREMLMAKSKADHPGWDNPSRKKNHVRQLARVEFNKLPLEEQWTLYKEEPPAPPQRTSSGTFAASPSPSPQPSRSPSPSPRREAAPMPPGSSGDPPSCCHRAPGRAPGNKSPKWPGAAMRPGGGSRSWRAGAATAGGGWQRCRRPALYLPSLPPCCPLLAFCAPLLPPLVAFCAPLLPPLAPLVARGPSAVHGGTW